MAIFKVHKSKVEQVGLNPDGFGSEFELRDLFAENLDEILGVRFLAKEFSTTNGRIDTLGLDENNSPVIIEYKWKESEEIFAQGLFYLSWLLKNKKHFEFLVKDVLGKGVKVSWDKPRVILVAQGFSVYVQAAVETVKNVELKSYSYYGKDTLQIDNVFTPKVLQRETAKRELKSATVPAEAYDLEYHLEPLTVDVRKKVEQLRDMLLQLPDVEEVVEQKSGITYKTTKSFTRLEFKKSWVQVLLRDPQYKVDKQHLVRDVTTYRWGFLGMVKLKSDSDIEYIYQLIKNSYESTL
jgi:predicted transport protein